MITLRHLRGFVAVCECLHFTKAAREVYLSQSALSTLIRQLETELGVQLIVRSTRAVELTPLGRDFYATARRLLTDFEVALADVRSLKSLARGRVAIAALPSLCTSILPPVIAQFRQQHPQIEIVLRDIVGEDIVSSLLGKSVDFALGHSHSSQELSAEPLLRDRLVALCPRQLAPSGARSMRWRELSGLPLIATSHRTTIRSLVQSAALARGVQLQIAVEAQQLSSVVACAAAGIGIAIVPSTGAPSILPKSLVRLELIDPVVHRELSLMTLANASLSPAATALYEAIRVAVGSKRRRLSTGTRRSADKAGDR